MSQVGGDRRAGVTVRAPGKVNLTLSVGPRRPGGYHELTTVFLAVSLHDVVRIAPAPRLTVTVRGPGAADIPAGDGNLAARAVRLIARAAGVEPAVAVHIDKRIPVAGGMAGGSADAAAALVGCDALWGLGLSREELRLLAAELGSDVGFPLYGGVALGTGRGELLTPLETSGAGVFHWVFAVSPHGLATPAVFQEHDRLRRTRPTDGERPAPERVAAVTDALDSGDAALLAAAVKDANDLQEAALSLRPELADTLRLGPEHGALAGLVSGSGPTCAFLTESAHAAATLATALSATGRYRDVLVTAGPTGGCTAVPD
ncbi:4-(cytidine 5'-diphospho)-2-C-methyl-D-erythritol kinase [Kitasatospora aureofaciens]|uniref:4-(cytidine 5'-diphospho)-2-C-methyl-D-erythritol kinase n=1 Tax=Kitasatospora aureofaciens TaxID=1894 RepID=UPI001C489015|nr:4-(cytidine 5'-diphospho)-2-C-methyl-D-erythritol kinase [Kitasatospora aureofaciens]MBV6702598.1 4-(cytidine 5'-diphospho)-2-C-methyl-D-erythritol kinase [Kitasatospora aureofaciens]